MRINRLDLTRYGIFTDFSIAFGEQIVGKRDLHVIYGPNESGKSTALAAVLDLLFGIETRTRYGFLHPYPTMRIGGDIEINGASKQYARIKRPQNSLLDGAEMPISDGTILGDIGSIDRASYTTMFSLDDHTLEEGGESILASKGDLGQLLFSASAGIANLGTKLATLRAEMEGFYKFRSRSGELSELKTRLADLKKKREGIDTIASEYSKLLEEQERLAGQYEGAIAERGLVQSRLDELRRQLAALPKLAALRVLRERAGPLAEIPEAPIGWVDELPGMQKAEIELATRAAGIETEIGNVSEELTKIVTDDRILKLGERIGQMMDLRARYVTADKDIPERRLRQRDADVAIERILVRLECDPASNPAGLVLGASMTGTLRDLMERQSGVDTSVEAAEEELTEARRRLAEAQTSLKETGGEALSPNRIATQQLISAVSTARADDSAARRRIAKRRAREQREALIERMRALSPWTGTAEALREISAPDLENIENWKSAIIGVDKRLERHGTDLERLLTEQRQLTAETEASGRVVGVLNDQQAADIRTAREEAWANHKRTLDVQSAEAFETSLRRDDIVTGSRIANAAEVSHLNQAGKKLAVVNANLATARENCRRAEDDRSNLEGHIANAIRVMAPSLPEDWRLPKLESWLQSRNKVLETLIAAEAAEREQFDAEQDGESVRRKLIDVARAAHLDCAADASTDTLLSIMQIAVDREAELGKLRKEIEERERDKEERERRAQKAQERKREWSEGWIKLCASCWLGKDRPIPLVPTVREVLKALDELSPLIEQRTSLADRILKMESDQTRFVSETQSLAAALDIEAVLAPLDIATLATRALEEARAAETARKAASARLQGAQARKKGIAADKEIHDHRKAEMIAHFSVDSLDEVNARLRDLERRQSLEQQAVDVEQEITVALGVSSIAAANEILDKIDRTAIEAEIAGLAGRFDDQDKRSRELFSEHSKASDRLEAVGGDDAVARLDERRRTTLLEIEEGARRYLRLRLGVAAAEQALRIYRDQHRSSMMARASAAFELISRGKYKSLRSQPDGDNDVLVAVGVKGGSKIASELSKGARFQLYLALRVAGYQEFAQSRRPVPFFADDIMETFDDFRAEESFKLFAQMAEVGQVIYFTHHRHLCDIARHVCPEVRIHEIHDQQ